MEDSFWFLFSDRTTRNIFDVIAKERKISFRDLRKSLIKNSPNIGEEDASERLNRLKAARLIDVKEAPLRDFRTYYVTANGLSAERELRKME